MGLRVEGLTALQLRSLTVVTSAKGHQTAFSLETVQRALVEAHPELGNRVEGAKGTFGGLICRTLFKGVNAASHTDKGHPDGKVHTHVCLYCAIIHNLNPDGIGILTEFPAFAPQSESSSKRFDNCLFTFGEASAARRHVERVEWKR